MTNTQGHGRRAKRSRILGSIFARAPHEAPAASQDRADRPCHAPNLPKRATTQSPAAGWRDVAARAARETLADRLCARFFAGRQTQAALASQTEFVSAGQRLQSLCSHAGEADIGHQNVAALLEARARPSGAEAEQDGDTAGASLQAVLTAKAA